LKILFLTENFPPETNAAATRVYERAIYWQKSGHKVTIITSAPNFPQGVLFNGYQNHWWKTEDMSNIKVVRVKTYISPNKGVVLRSLDFLSFGVMGFFVGLFQTRPDIVVATSPQFFSAVAGWAVAACRRLPFIFELGDLWPSSIAAVGAIKKGVLLNWVEKFELFLYRRSSRIAALTHAFKINLVRRGIEESKIDVVLNGVDLPRYAPRKRDEKLARKWLLEDKFVIGYVGTHGMAHGLKNVLNVAEQLRKNERIRFLLAGAGAERDKLLQHAKTRSLSNVIFMPMQPKEAMPAVWSLCNVALVHLKDDPAFSEVIPSKIFEAMAMGLPILIAIPDGEARRVVEDNSAGIWVPPENPKAFVNAVKKLSNDGQLYDKLSANSLAAAPNYSRSIQADRMISVFKKALL
jgi:glycosyltransferase involved in cell wall biosynthesis